MLSAFKAELLGKNTIFVDPWGTSQFCSTRQNFVMKETGDRQHICPNCGEMI